MDDLQTLPQHFLAQVQRHGDVVALRQKELGIWREFTWQDSYDQVQAFALGMIALGLSRGAHVSTVGDNDRQYLWAYIGIQAIGGAVVGLYTDSTPDEIAYIIGHSDSVFVLAKDQEQCDKLIEIRDRIPQVKRVIYWDDRGLWNYDNDWLISFTEVQELGETIARRESRQFDTEVNLGQGTDLAMLFYTSGTTGLPKGVMLSHNNIMHSALAYIEVDPRFASDNHVSFLPMGWIAEPVLGIASHVVTGMIMNFPEEPETVRQNVREIAPENILYNSRLWDSVLATVQVRIKDASWINRRLYHLFLPIGYQVADKKFAKEAPGPGLRLAYTLGDLLVFAPIRNQLGLSRLRSGYTGGAALSPDAMRFFHALGINLKQVYGSTEVSGGATLHHDGDIKFASVGLPAPGVHVRISLTGEIQISGPTVMIGYYKNPAETAEAIVVDNDGRRWFCTGDAGYIDEDGHIIYLDRVKDMIELANGEQFSPQFIEGRLKFSPYIRDVMAIGGIDREAVTALIIIDFENVGHWAEKQGLNYTTFVDLSQRLEVYNLIQEAILEVNQSLPPAARIRHFVLMHKEFDADEAEMTRTRKLRRTFLYDRYQDIIDAMYAGQNDIRVRAPVRYQDGREGMVETDIRIVSLAV